MVLMFAYAKKGIIIVFLMDIRAKIIVEKNANNALNQLALNQVIFGHTQSKEKIM